MNRYLVESVPKNERVFHVLPPCLAHISAYFPNGCPANYNDRVYAFPHSFSCALEIVVLF